ncbi:hypothetical protein LMB49_10790 [Limosilactobacillus reuteri]|uniref:hypothetical protein n=1 Tax=Limosilactobacillus reuteri TaxID=1598 RepID=UPI001E3D43B5|nr:hypothetical protein [Limosilactobacillus reuteri]MCC4370553.1 hypothetical protein [Limosilactobacillus reuteri]MCC4371878.1 hypothetical protein [Limosilactobacillus reuteri]MCC4509349.1 hypothetical protein [Limosilactobacillus reuteri]MCC4509392.1 hypothetical protein [Limosilactobacillus reuteri]
MTKTQDLVKMAKKNGVKLSSSVVANRLERGWSEKRIITTPPRKTGKTYTYNGHSYTLRDLVSLAKKDYGIEFKSPQTIDNRLRRGWTIERAISTSARNKIKVDSTPAEIQQSKKESQKRAIDKYLKAHPDAIWKASSKQFIRELATLAALKQLKPQLEEALAAVKDGEIPNNIKLDTIGRGIREYSLGKAKLNIYVKKYADEEGLVELINMVDERLKNGR